MIRGLGIRVWGLGVKDEGLGSRGFEVPIKDTGFNRDIG